MNFHLLLRCYVIQCNLLTRNIAIQKLVNLQLHFLHTNIHDRQMTANRSSLSRRLLTRVKFCNSVSLNSSKSWHLYIFMQLLREKTQRILITHSAQKVYHFKNVILDSSFIFISVWEYVTE